MKKNFFLIVYLLLPFSLFAEDKWNFRINDFSELDISRNHFRMTVSGKDANALCQSLKGISDKKFHVYIDENKTEIFPGTVKRGAETNTYEFYFFSYKKIPSNEPAIVSIHYDGEEQDTQKYKLEDSGKPQDQPLIDKITPSAGVAGGTISIVGKNLGKDLDKVSIYLYDIQQDQLFDRDMDYDEPFRIQKASYDPNNCDYATTDDRLAPYEYIREIGVLTPLSLSIPLPSGEQTLLFALPNEMREYANDSLIRKNIQFRLFVKGRPSEFRLLTILPDNWKIKIISLTVFLTVLGWGILAFLLKKWLIFPDLLIDKSINSYSLNRLQALAWTAVLISSYFYVAICSGLLLRTGQIPDFNGSLIGLMGVSYTGLISSHYLSRRRPENVMKSSPALIKDLITTDGEVDMAKVQLFGFTLVSVLIYIYNLYYANVLLGLPDIPPTLHALLLTSQTGYLSSKMLKNGISVNIVVPDKVNQNQKEKSFELVGSGFVDNILIKIEETELPAIKAEVLSPTAIAFKLDANLNPGSYNLLVVPPQGSNFKIQNAFQVIENNPEPEANQDEEKIIADGEEKEKITETTSIPGPDPEKKDKRKKA